MILAETRFERFGRAIRDNVLSTGSTTLLFWLLAIAAIAGAIGLSVYCIRRYYVNVVCQSRSQLFRDLCRVHELSSEEVTLLMALAHRVRLPDAALLFVQPQHFHDFREQPESTGARLLQKLFSKS